MIIKKLKEKLPYPIKQSAKYLYGAIPPRLRYGKVFWETYNFLQESQWWSKEKLEEYQMQQLSKLLHHAYENVPYYRMIFDERGQKLKDIQNFDDLRKLPYLTKDIIRENLLDLIARNFPKSKLWYVTTGGSTGIPMGLYWEKGITDQKEWAFMWRQWNWARFGFGEKRVTLRGKVINKFKKGKRQWWEYDPINNALILSSYDMKEKNLSKYIDAIKIFRPVAIQGYPSSLYILANFLRKSNLRIKNIKCILASSEMLYSYQIEIIEKYLGAKIYDHYGNTERNALVMQCEKGSYHIISEYGIMELIGKDGKPITKEGEKGEIVATGFINYAMPFIRYRTGDLGVFSSEKCSCGRNYPLLKRVKGRLQDFIVTKTNGRISLTSLIFAQHFEAFSRIKELQIVQQKIGSIKIKIVKTPEFTEKDENEILLKIKNACRKELVIDFDYVSHITRTKNGKYNFLIQELPVNFGDR